MHRLTFGHLIAVFTLSGLAQGSLAQGVIRFGGRVVDPTCAIQVGDGSGAGGRSPSVQHDAEPERWVEVDGVRVRLQLDPRDRLCGNADFAVTARLVAPADAAGTPAAQPAKALLVVNVQ